MQTTKHGFVYPDDGDRFNGNSSLKDWFQKSAEASDKFVDTRMGSFVKSPTSVKCVNADWYDLADNGVLTWQNAERVSLGGVFDWFDETLNYQIIWQVNEFYSDTSIAFRARYDGTDDHAQYGYVRDTVFVDTDAEPDNAQTGSIDDDETIVSPRTGSGQYTTLWGRIYLTRVRNNTKLHGDFVGSSNRTFHLRNSRGSFVLDPTVETFDGFTLYPKIPTKFSGTLRVRAEN